MTLVAVADRVITVCQAFAASVGYSAITKLSALMTVEVAGVEGVAIDDVEDVVAAVGLESVAVEGAEVE